MDSNVNAGSGTPQPAPQYKAKEVAALTRLALPTVYEQAKQDPERWGLVHHGRAVRFVREKIDRLVSGEA